MKDEGAILTNKVTQQDRNEAMGEWSRRRMLVCLIAGVLLLHPAGMSCGWAMTIYSYIDDQGNLVSTDSIETIPDKYRPRVKTHERPDPVAPPAPSVLHAARRAVHNQVKDWGWTIPSLRVEGLSSQQSSILTYAGGLAVILFGVMLFSKSQLLRLLGFCLLIVLGIGTPLLLYVSDGGALDTMKGKVSAAGQAQQNRLQQTGR